MKKYTRHNKTIDTLKRSFAVTTIIVLVTFIRLNSCGGGVVPYVPTQTGVTRTTSTQFFLIEKGVAVDMFDIKKLQPIFRNIILTGNERKKHKSKVEAAKKDSGAVSSKEIVDSTAVSSEDEIVPILNVHRLH